MLSDIKVMRNSYDNANYRGKNGALFFNGKSGTKEKDLENLLALSAFDSDLQYFRGGTKRAVM